MVLLSLIDFKHIVEPSINIYLLLSAIDNELWYLEHVLHTWNNSQIF